MLKNGKKEWNIKIDKIKSSNENIIKTNNTKNRLIYQKTTIKNCEILNKQEKNQEIIITQLKIKRKRPVIKRGINCTWTIDDV